MSAAALSTAAADRPRLAAVHWLLAAQSVVVVLLTINRLSPLALGYVASNEFLRWVDFNNMLVLPLASLVAFYLLKRRLELSAASPARDGRAHLALNLAFIVGAYLLGASYGDHEVTNYLHARFCAEDTASALCRIIIFNDDDFSHWVFFAGFVLVNTALMLLQVLFPHRAPVTGGDLALLVLNGVFIGAGVFANLAFEVIGLDLYVVALLALIAALLLWRRGPQPLLVYYATAFWLGLVETFLYKAVA
jgi:hypothetical protein